MKVFVCFGRKKMSNRDIFNGRSLGRVLGIPIIFWFTPSHFLLSGMKLLLLLPWFRFKRSCVCVSRQLKIIMCIHLFYFYAFWFSCWPGLVPADVVHPSTTATTPLQQQQQQLPATGICVLLSIESWAAAAAAAFRLKRGPHEPNQPDSLFSRGKGGKNLSIPRHPKRR